MQLLNPLSWPGRLGSLITSPLVAIIHRSLVKAYSTLSLCPVAKSERYAVQQSLPYILPTLTRLINSSVACSEFPRAWKKSVIVPHLKDGDHEVPNNNRRISLLPVHSKVAEKIALIQFNDFLTKQDKLIHH